MARPGLTRFSWIDHPAFVVGHPKSGTSLLVGMFDGHPEVLVFPEETMFFRFTWRRARRVLRGTSNQPRRVAVLGDLVLNRSPVRHLRDTESVSHPVRGEYDYSGFDFQRFRQAYTEWLRETGGSLRGALEGLPYAAAGVLARGQDLSHIGRWVEKTPGHYDVRTVARLSRWYPDVRFIHIMRDPRDVWISYKKAQPDLKAVEFVRSWKEAERAVHINRRRCGEDRYLAIRYEDLVADPPRYADILSRHLGVNNWEGLLQPTKLGMPWGGNSVWGQRYDGISGAPVGRFRAQQASADIELIEACLGTAMQRWNYPVDRPLTIAKTARYRARTVGHALAQTMKKLLFSCWYWVSSTLGLRPR